MRVLPLLMCIPNNIKYIKYPLCKNCRFFLKNKNNMELSRCMYFGEKDLITGNIIYEFTNLVRHDENKCGVKGIYFEEYTLLNKTKK